jgi:26S proteasome regulatory subunit N12
LELLSEEALQRPEITFCTQLDKHLVIGSYDQVLVAAARPPVPHYSFFLTSLLETVRINIGECVAASYSTLTLEAATKILMFEETQETLEFIREFYPSWVFQGNLINLVDAPTARSTEVPSLKLIAQTLSYATELERIV